MWDVDASGRARTYLIECASCVSLALKFRRSSATVCPDDGCMSRKSVGIRRPTNRTPLASRLERTHYWTSDVYKHPYSTNTQSQSYGIYLDASERVRSVIPRLNRSGGDLLIGHRRSEVRPTPSLPLLSTLLGLVGPRRSECFLLKWPSPPVALGSTDLGGIRQLALRRLNNTLTFHSPAPDRAV